MCIVYECLKRQEGSTRVEENGRPEGNASAGARVASGASTPRVTRDPSERTALEKRWVLTSSGDIDDAGADDADAGAETPLADADE